MLFFHIALLYIREFISLIGVSVITFGAVRSSYQLGSILLSNKKFNVNFIRLEFGRSIVLGLEFMVGADIIGSMIDPDYYRLGLLGILVIIRSILSYFLNLELKTLTENQRQALDIKH